jgi:hypothetical protein
MILVVPSRRDIWIGAVVALGVLAMIVAFMHARLSWAR